MTGGRIRSEHRRIRSACGQAAAGPRRHSSAHATRLRSGRCARTATGRRDRAASCTREWTHTKSRLAIARSGTAGLSRFSRRVADHRAHRDAPSPATTRSWCECRPRACRRLCGVTRGGKSQNIDRAVLAVVHLARLACSIDERPRAGVVPDEGVPRPVRPGATSVMRVVVASREAGASYERSGRPWPSDLAIPCERRT